MADAGQLIDMAQIAISPISPDFIGRFSYREKERLQRGSFNRYSASAYISLSAHQAMSEGQRFRPELAHARAETVRAQPRRNPSKSPLAGVQLLLEPFQRDCRWRRAVVWVDSQNLPPVSPKDAARFRP